MRVSIFIFLLLSLSAFSVSAKEQITNKSILHSPKLFIKQCHQDLEEYQTFQEFENSVCANFMAGYYIGYHHGRLNTASILVDKDLDLEGQKTQLLKLKDKQPNICFPNKLRPEDTELSLRGIALAFTKASEEMQLILDAESVPMSFYQFLVAKGECENYNTEKGE